MRRHLRAVVVCGCVLGGLAVPAGATDLTLPSEGRVVVELIGSEAAFRNTLAVTSPAVAVAITGCGLEPSNGLPGVKILSEKNSQRGCRVELDADPATDGIQPFAAGTVMRFGFCAQTDGDDDCEFVWSSDPASNSDALDHVRTTTIVTGAAFRLNWEDTEGLGDQDFNDLIAVVRIVADTDGDGLWDDWETSGVDSDGDGTVDLVLAGADPMRKDIYVEIDWMDCSVAGSDCAAGDTHSHQPKAAAVQAVVDAFDDANVANPGGRPDGINLHLELSNGFAHQNTLIIPNACFTGAAGTGFDAIKSDPANFGPANPRRFTHHYMLWTHRQTATNTWSGCAELPGNDIQVSLGAWNYSCSGGTRSGLFCLSNANCPGVGASCQPDGDIDGDGTNDQDVGTIQQQAGTLMHELGHNLNLGHGGGDWTNNKPNYLSVMNYTFQLVGIPPTDPDAGGPLAARIDYSRAALPTLVETGLSEPAGIGDGTDNTFFACPGGNAFSATGAGTGAINWNCDTDSLDDPVSSDVNLDATVACVGPGTNGVRNTVPSGDDVISGQFIGEGANRQCDTTPSGDDVQWRPLGPLTGYFDWANIKYDFQNSTDFDDGQHQDVSTQVQELTFETFAVTLAADVAVAVAAAPDPVVTGSTVTYSITVSNSRPGTALNVVLSDSLPAATAFVSCAATGGGVCSGTGNDRIVTFPSIPGGGSAVVTIVAEVTCSVVDGTAISNVVSVTATQDADPANNTATVSVTASNPPPAIGPVSVSAPQLWPPNHRMVDVGVDYTVTDNCGPLTNTIGVSSSDPVNGLGDGDTAPDWEVVDASRVWLRAERSGTGPRRVYTLTVTSTDSSGASSSRTATVFVPRNQ
jgi:uncharacterized repeat protein (TIGR01451 family)